MGVLTAADHEHFGRHGYVVRGDLFDATELARLQSLFDADRRERHYRWHPYGHHQQANYDLLVTSPGFDALVRHPRVLAAVGELMDGPVCFGEIGARYMAAYHGTLHRSWHRDRPHWDAHPLRTDYLQLMLYLTDVDASTHCFSISPEAVDDPVLADAEQQLRRGGVVDITGNAGTACLFNVAVLHTATTRPTSAPRKSVQIYYGHREREPLANDSVVPAALWRDSADPETRAFYGNLNQVTRLYLTAFGG